MNTLASLPRLIVFPDRFATGWNGVDGADVFPALDATETFLSHWPTFAHAVGYLVPDENESPRLTAPALAYLDVEPEMHWLFVDVDNANHAPWPSKTLAEKTVRNFLAKPSCKEAGAYTTRAGFRLLWRLDPPIPVGLFKSWADMFLTWLSKAIDLPFADPEIGSGGIDKTCDQWQRMYALPYVMRDGAATDPFVSLKGPFEAPLSWRPAIPPTRAVYHAHVAQFDGGVSGSGLPPLPDATAVDSHTWRVLAAGETHAFVEKLQNGSVLAKKGARDNTMIKLVASIVARLRTTDPLVPWNILARSIAADTTEGAPTLEKLWNRCNYFTSREVDRIVTSKTVETNPPIVALGKKFFILNTTTGGYDFCVDAPLVVLALEKTCQGLNLVTRNDKGKPRELNELLVSYGALAKASVAKMGTPSTTFDKTTQIVYERACSMLPVEPLFNEHIDHWLSLLAGDLKEKLLDWLATLPMLDKPTCGLFLRGPSGIGKGMLVAGISALWGFAVSYSDVMGSFNEALMLCPIIHADEELPTRGFSARFRSLIGESSRPLTRKFMPTTTLVGCPRLIITVNNPDALHLQEQLSSEDIDAISTRILFVDTDDKAGVYLQEIGGRTATHDWTGPNGAIAKHVMYLYQNRQVTLGKRFLVEGVKTQWHQDLLLRNGLNEQVLACVAHCFLRPSNKPVRGVQCFDDDTVAVNTSSLRSVWPTFMQENAPDAGALSRALGAIAVKTERVRWDNGTRPKVHLVRIEDILRVADRLQIGDIDVLAKRLRMEKGASDDTM